MPSARGSEQKSTKAKLKSAAVDLAIAAGAVGGVAGTVGLLAWQGHSSNVQQRNHWIQLAQGPHDRAQKALRSGNIGTYFAELTPEMLARLVQLQQGLPGNATRALTDPRPPSEELTRVAKATKSPEALEYYKLGVPHSDAKPEVLKLQGGDLSGDAALVQLEGVVPFPVKGKGQTQWQANAPGCYTWYIPPPPLKGVKPTAILKGVSPGPCGVNWTSSSWDGQDLYPPPEPGQGDEPGPTRSPARAAGKLWTPSSTSMHIA